MSGTPFASLRDIDIEQQRAAQHAVVTALMPFVDRSVNPIVLVFAMARAMRVLLRKMPEGDQQAVHPLLFAYIRGAVSEPKEGSALWSPDRPQ